MFRHGPVIFTRLLFKKVDGPRSITDQLLHVTLCVWKIPLSAAIDEDKPFHDIFSEAKLQARSNDFPSILCA